MPVKKSKNKSFHRSSGETTSSTKIDHHSKVVSQNLVTHPAAESPKRPRQHLFTIHLTGQLRKNSFNLPPESEDDLPEMLHPLIFVVRWFQCEKCDSLFRHRFPYGSPRIPFVSENCDAVQSFCPMIQSFPVIFVGFSNDISEIYPSTVVST